MNIVFICGSLEPGRDGVGDYTRKLGLELSKRGYQVTAVAFHDRHIRKNSAEEQECDGLTFPVLRLGASESFKKRAFYTQEWLKKWDPDWISLQFVPYSYQDKGLPWRLGAKLATLGQGKKWHIMFHELWIEGTNARSKIISLLQQMIIRETARRLKPVVAHTHLPVYRKRLKSAEITSKKLPVFSNISGTSLGKDHQENFLTIGFFSQLIVRESVINFLREFSQNLTEQKYGFRILIMGGDAESKLKLEKGLKQLLHLENRIIRTGFLPEKELFQMISTCDVGITPVPRHVLGKSGSVAAFLSQGIPVAAPFVKPGYEHLGMGFLKKKMKLAVFKEPTLLKFNSATEAARKLPAKVNVTTVANKFIADLAKSSI